MYRRRSFFSDTKNAKVFRYLAIVILLVLMTWLAKQWNLDSILMIILSALSPLFIGLGIAWLLNPIVKMLENKGIRRGYGVIISYLLLILILVGLVGVITLFIVQLADLAISMKYYVEEMAKEINNTDINSIFKDLNPIFKEFEPIITDIFTKSKITN